MNNNAGREKVCGQFWIRSRSLQSSSSVARRLIPSREDKRAQECGKVLAVIACLLLCAGRRGIGGMADNCIMNYHNAAWSILYWRNEHSY